MTQDGTSHGLCACPENAGQKRETTLGTHIARAPERPAARCYGTHAGSNTQRDQWAAGPCKEAPVPPGRGCSETKKCGHTAPIPTPRPKRLRSSQAAGTPWSCTWDQALVNCRELYQVGHTPSAWQAKIAGKKNRDPPHPDRSGARPARCRSLHDVRGERCGTGQLRPLAGPCGRSETAESRCRMDAAHGAGQALVAVYVGSSAARSQKLQQLCYRSVRQRQY